jgi:integrase
VYGRTKEEAAAKLRKAQANLSAGTLSLDSKTTLATFLTKWLDWRRDHVRPSTWRAQEVLVRVHILPDPIAKRALGKLTTGDIDAFIGRLSRKQFSAHRGSASKIDPTMKTFSPRSVQMVHNLLKASITQARKWGYVAVNVSTDATCPTVPEPVRNPFDAEEARRIVHSAKEHRLGALFTVAIALGLRPGEALALRWEDLTLDGLSPQLVVNHTLTKDLAKKVMIAPPKTRRSARVVALPPTCVVALKERRKGQREERLLSGPNWFEPIPGLVFETVDGRPIDKDNLGRIWHLLLDKAEVPRRRLYEARHTAATLLLAQGVHARVVMDLLGHSTIKLTMDTYSHVMPALQREAADAMERALA